MKNQEGQFVYDYKQYFNKARVWYGDIYVACFVERSWISLAASIIFLGLVVNIIYLAFVQEDNVDIDLLIKVDDISSEIASFKKLDGKFGSAITGNPELKNDLVVAEYLLEQYVMNYEKYTSHSLTSQDKFIMANSTPEIYNQFESLVNINNPLSPVITMQNQASRIVKVTNIIMLERGEAEIYFDANVVSYTEDIDNSFSSWKITIKYDMSEIKLLKQKKAGRVDFVVKSYKAEKLK